MEANSELSENWKKFLKDNKYLPIPEKNGPASSDKSAPFCLNISEVQRLMVPHVSIEL